jgi:hypothetical protein
MKYWYKALFVLLVIAFLSGPRAYRHVQKHGIGARTQAFRM